MCEQIYLKRSGVGCVRQDGLGMAVYVRNKGR